MHYVFVINGRTDKQFIQHIVKEQIESISYFTDYEIYITTEKRDATRFVRQYKMPSGNEKVCFVACGGDGTINEVVSGIVGDHNKVLAVLAYGTGNDFIKYYKNLNFKSVEAMLSGQEKQIDVIRVNDRYSINVCNFGFDAAVARIANGLPRNTGGKSIYRKALLRAFLFNRSNKFDIFIDGEKIQNSPVLLSTFSNCRFVGGEFMCAPYAQNDDGLIDVCVIQPMSLFKLLSCLSAYKNGTYMDDGQYAEYITYKRTNRALVCADHEFEACIDGEIILDSKFSVEVLPLEITFVVPQGN